MPVLAAAGRPMARLGLAAVPEVMTPWRMCEAASATAVEKTRWQAADSTGSFLPPWATIDWIAIGLQ